MTWPLLCQLVVCVYTHYMPVRRITLLDPPAAARLLGVPLATLARWRYRRTGPPFVHVGRRVRYAESDLIKWLAANRVEPQSPAQRDSQCQI
jgi:predicted DNA-binding transcriptional regulator AlpA